MKNRIVPILIVLVTLISLLILPTNAASKGVLMAGYSKVDIDPNRHTDANGELAPIIGLPMGGYGAVTERLSGTIDPEKQTLGTTSGMDDNGDDKFTAADGLYATCTALTDQYGTTIIHFGVDNTNGDQNWTNDARTAVFNALKANGYDVPYSNIFVTCSHSHSSPSLTFDKSASNVDKYPEIAKKTKLYREWVCSQMAAAAVNAMGDRVEVTMTKGSVDASDAISSMYSGASASQKRMNWVRHYTSTKDGETIVGGSNFGAYGTELTKKEVSSPNDVMHLVQFTPVSGSKKPILLVNWTAHATMNSTGGSGGANDSTYGGIHHYDTSADYIGALRYWLETAGACKNSTINYRYYRKVDSTQTYRVSFISGAAGNVTPTTSIMTSTSLPVYQDPDVKGTSSTSRSPEGRLYGQKLAAIARYGLANSMTSALDTSAIRVQSKTFTYNRQQPTKSDKDFIYSMREVSVGNLNLIEYLAKNSDNWRNRSTYYAQFPDLAKFTSRYQLSNMNNLVTNYYDKGYTSGSMTVSAIAIGTQLSMTVNPCELADRFSDGATLFDTTDNDWDDLISTSTYGTPLVMGYTNGGSGYVPNSLAYNYNSGTGTGGDGADNSDHYITGSYESSGASFARGTGENLIEFYADMLAEVNTTTSRIQCECGGKASGVGGHVCSNKEFLPWNDATSLPTVGNYYLTTDVTLSKQYTVNTLRLDLNGHNITHKVTDTTDSRVLAVSNNHTLYITDSTNKPGSIKRDLSSLTDPAISNWGLLVIIYDGGTYVQYGGILDSTGNSTTGGGSCVSVNYKGSIFKMYGGTLTGGTARTGGLVYNTGTTTIYGGTLSNGTAENGGLLYNTASGNVTINGGNFTGGTCELGGAIGNAGTLTIMGGTITGNKTKTNGSCPGIYVTDNGTLTIGGTANIDDNKKTSNSVEINIRFKDETKLATNFTVNGAFTGKAGVYVNATHANGFDIGESNNASFTANNLWLDYRNDYPLVVSGDDIIMATIRNQCECGGKASGMTGHTCKKVDFVPWTSTTSLPTSGNYYLTGNVVTSAQTNITSTLHLDLNGKTITHKVSASEGALAEAGKTHNTRVLSVDNGSYLSITGSTDTPGAINRDLSNLTDTQKGKITNYGLILLINDGGSATVYNGHLDATGGCTTGGGGAVSSNSAGANFTMYGGQLTGCSATTSAGVLFNKGTATIYGGTFTDGKSDNGGFAYNTGTLSIFGGTITDNRTLNNGFCPGIYCDDDGKLTIGGDVVFENNRKYKTNGTVAMNSYIDIRFADESKMATNFTVKGAFTGKAGFYIGTAANRTAGWAIGISDNAYFTAENLYENYYNPKKDLAIDGNKIIYAYEASPYAASITVGNNVTYADSLSEAIEKYPGGDAVLTLLKASDENVTFTQDTILDLNGCSLTGNVTANGKLTVKDSRTDDLTIDDSFGYGMIPSTLPTEATVAAEGYVKITETDGTSFHKLILETAGVNLRTSTAGIYYTCDFGGDEVIKANIKSFGVALGANKIPDFRPKTYTEFPGSKWNVGINADGSTKNQSNGTVLQGILSEDNGYSANKHNALVPIWGVAYVEWNDGTRKTEEDIKKFSLRNVIEGYEGFNGADDLWEELTQTQKNYTVTMYETYMDVMQSWDIPNIKQAYVDSQDDGTLKILMIGHSLGMDSTYFVPEIFKNETGKDVVVGTLYHSGCRLSQHASYLNNSTEAYVYLEYDTSKHNQWQIWQTGVDKIDSKGNSTPMTKGFAPHTPGQAHDSWYYDSGMTLLSNAYGVTMQFGIEQHDWDVVVMQAGVFEAANIDDHSKFNPDITADIKTIQNYVKANDVNKYTSPKFAWNITWSAPEDKALTSGTSYDTLLASKFGDSAEAMYEAIINTYNSQVKTACNWDYVFPAGTAVQNAKTVLTDKQIHRDMIHGTDLIRLAVAYTWYCEMFDKDISECGFAPISNAIRFKETDRKTGKDYTLTTEEKGYVKDFVRNAMTNPYEVTQIKKPDDVLKVLVVGHSTGMDPIYFVPEIAEANGVKMIVGDLYHSGCKLSQHESFIKNNREAYVYLEYDNTSDKNYWEIWQTGVDKVKDDGKVETLDEGFAQHFPNQAHDSWYYGSGMTMLSNSYGVTMQWAIQQHDWDIVIMMGGRLETTDIFTDGDPLDITDIGIIRNYILANDIDKTTVPDFAWNTLWTNPEYDEAWIATLSSNHQTSYKKNWTAVQTHYDNSTTCLYEHLVTGLKDLILPAYNFDYLLHNNTVIQNAKAMGLTNAEIYRDYTHGTDFTRMMTACNWYCGLTGADIDTLEIPSIPKALRYKNRTSDYTLTDTELYRLRTCVRNAIENPYEVTIVNP